MHYFVTFVDDYSRKVWVYLIKNKNDVLGIFLKWKKIVETQTGRKVERSKDFVQKMVVSIRMIQFYK